MFHAGGHKGLGKRGRSSTFNRHQDSTQKNHHWKAPLRCGVLFCGTCCLLLVIGIILTWLGFHDVFGETVPITGPILLSVGGLLLLLGVRQFYLAHTRKKAGISTPGQVPLPNSVIDPEETEHLTYHQQNHHEKEIDSTIDDCSNLEDKQNYQPAQLSFCDPSHVSPAPRDYPPGNSIMWPPISTKSPLYSTAVMLYRGPASLSGGALSFVSAPTLPADVKDIGDGAEMMEVDKDAIICKDATIYPPSLRDDNVATNISTSSTYQQCPSLLQTYIPSSAACLECSRMFPAHYLPCHNTANVRVGLRDNGISSLPTPTIFVMLRTLEIQETI